MTDEEALEIVKKLEWTDRHNCYAARIGAFHVNINWSTDRNNMGYMVSFESIKKIEPVGDLVKAQIYSVKLAHKYLTAALDVLKS